MKKTPSKNGPPVNTIKGKGLIHAPPEFILRFLLNPENSKKVDELLKEGMQLCSRNELNLYDPQFSLLKRLMILHRLAALNKQLIHVVPIILDWSIDVQVCVAY